MDNLRVTYIQSNIYWEQIEANLSMFEEKIWQIDQPTDLIVLPEMFTTGFTMKGMALAEPMNSKTTRWMKQQAAQTQATIVGSCIIQEKGECFNRLLVVHPNGEVQHYDKRHLFSLAGEDDGYTAGLKRLVFKVRGWRVMPLICYDLRFPVWSRSRKQIDDLYEYDLLLYVANWPKPRIRSWDRLLSARAIENNSYVMGVNRTGEDGVGLVYSGHSAVYDYLGDTLAFSENEEIITVSLHARSLNLFRSKFPFQKDADDFGVH